MFTIAAIIIGLTHAYADDVPPAQAALIAYGQALEGKSVAALNLHPAVRFSGPLLAKPLTGRDAVRGLYGRVFSGMNSINITRISFADDGGCIELAIELEGQPAPLAEVHCLNVQNGQITKITLYLDPRPLLGGK